MVLSEVIIFSVLAALAVWHLYDDITDLISSFREEKETARPFSVSEHFSRIEKVADDITREYEREDPCTVLWWGLDGLKLNEDGTMEWIRKYGRQNIQKDGETIDVSTLEDTSYKFIIGGPGGSGGAGCASPVVIIMDAQRAEDGRIARSVIR